MDIRTQYTPEPLVFEAISQPEAITRSRDYLSVMRRRRTVRDFSPRAVPRELIENAVAAACTAPSGANQQPWTFCVVADAGLKARIREAAETEERENYAHRMSEEWKGALTHLGTDWHKPHLTDAPYLIVVFAQSYGIESTGEPEEARRVKHYYVTESVGIAVGMLLTSLHLSGLATLTHTPSPMGFLADALGRPSNERAFVLIPVGYPAEDAQVPHITKKPLDETLVWYE